MIIKQAVKTSAELEMEMCRAMFEKDPEMLIELVSQWLEANRLTLDEDFCVPPICRTFSPALSGPTIIFQGDPRWSADRQRNLFLFCS